jgi:hypothetical protein
MQSTFPAPNAHPTSETAPAFRALELLLTEPHTAASLAAALAVCDHPPPSRAAFVSCEPHGAQSLVTWCACCGAAAHTAMGAQPRASDFIRTTLAQLVSAEQLGAVEALALGLRELEHTVDTAGLREPIERCASRLATITDAVRSFARSAALAGVERLGAVASRLADRDESSQPLAGW